MKCEEFLGQLKRKILEGYQVTKEDIEKVENAPLKELCETADEIRRHFCKNKFDICTIINGKSGRCSEDCKFCAQSACYKTKVNTYVLLPVDEIVKQAHYNSEKGVLRYSVVTSGKKLNDREVEQICEAVRRIKNEVGIEVCISGGLLSEAHFRKLKEAGVTRVHNNLETSERYFKEVCTTHKYEEKLEAIQAAKRVGMEVCSGGIIGMGETWEDRIDMAFRLRELGVNSVPINVLNPIPGTPFENNRRLSMEEICRCVALYRLILPDGVLRLAGGRGLMEEKGRAAFCSGANAAISGDMLTTQGITIDADLEMLKELNYKVELL